MKHNCQIKKLFTANCTWMTLLMKIIHTLKKSDYYDFYVQSDTLLLVDIFENFRNKCVEIYELDPAYFLPALGLAWQACLKKTEVKLELLTKINMLLMVEKRIRGGMCHAIHRYGNANNKYVKNYDTKIMYLDGNNLYG